MLARITCKNIESRILTESILDFFVIRETLLSSPQSLVKSDYLFKQLSMISMIAVVLAQYPTIQFYGKNRLYEWN